MEASIERACRLFYEVIPYDVSDWIMVLNYILHINLHESNLRLISSVLFVRRDVSTPSE